MTGRAVTLRFRRWPNPVSQGDQVFATLLSRALHRPVQIVLTDQGKVDVEIESVYGRPELPDLRTRTYRFLASHSKKGIDFSSRKYSLNQQPSGNSRYSIFFTGENERPPFGEWDVYLSFDLHSFGGRNAYLPLWWITSSDLIEPVVSPYLGKSISIDEMLSNRESSWRKRQKFCVAFVGKAYPFRMQAIAALSKLGKVDVYGGIARNCHKKAAQAKHVISQDYKFVFAFENDLYPGYVTEKSPEAWATGAIPLYWGLDTKGYINQEALINLANYSSLEEFVDNVAVVKKSVDVGEAISSQPFLKKRPDLNEVIRVLRQNLPSLVA